MAIGPFVDEFSFLDNFYPASIPYGGLVFPSVENAFQAMKCVDIPLRQCFVPLSPALAKMLGRVIPLRDDWDDVKVKIMRHLLERKFCIPELARALIATGANELVEKNDWGDQFWGWDTNLKYGKNMLGLLLMEIRTSISPVYTVYTESRS